jgi:mannosylfructose-6-phosphate phosphatase
MNNSDSENLQRLIRNRLREVRMLVTDADGTLFGQKPEFEQFRAFRAKVDQLRRENDAIWTICTGRSLRSFNRVFQPMRVFGIEPDYVIARHAYIYERGRSGYWPHWLWNARVLWLQWRDASRVRRALPVISRAVLARNPFAHVVYRGSERVCFRFDDEGATAFGAEVIRAQAKPFKHLQIFQFPGEVDVRTIPFTKGLAVAELARRLGIGHQRILVVGDSHNDISMIEINVGCRTACPGNAVPEVVEAVHRAGGHIAAGQCLAGVMEILDAYETGKVNSALPAGFHENWNGSNPVRLPKHAGRLNSRMANLALFIVVVYVSMLALAVFFPKKNWAKLIGKPYQALVLKAERAVKSLLSE